MPPSPLQLELALIHHEVDNTLILQRAVDGYVNATAMCQAVGKNFADYSRLSVTQAFLNELSGSMGIPMDLLVITRTTGRNEERGTGELLPSDHYLHNPATQQWRLLSRIA